ncbi:DNA primase large subunit-like [Tubulanus polymorphus]|uniref:DNA primase large subunit-like n=1 Tax=Tubulanus polymorphus TaxID=672921 RepID=UPI003DA4A5D2
MELNRRRKKDDKFQSLNKSLQRDHLGLQLYTLPPIDNITLQEFEEFAAERAKALKSVETIGIRVVKSSKEYKDALREELKKSNIKTFNKPGQCDFNDIRKDQISHFILRLAYCKSEDLKRWFITQEVDLFRHRFTEESSNNIKLFLDSNNLDYSPIPEAERERLKPLLVSSSYDITPAKIQGIDYFKVPFTEAHDLVRSRKIYLEKGYAYVPHSDLVSLIAGVFRTNLSHALSVTARALPNLEEDNRLVPILNGLNKGYFGQDYTNKKSNTGEVTAAMVDELSKKSFPPCMQQVHQGLRQTHHLKHGGRMQYGLFLKAIGMSLDEALKFWRAEFSKIMDVDKFDKQYAYNIRHNYGKEGKRADYTPYSCMKIIMSNTPGQGDSHGCPFKHSDAGLLRQRFQAKGISKDGIDDVMAYVKGGHYQLACGRYFEVTHMVNDTGIAVNHPNQFFEESQKYESGERKPESVSQTSNVRIVKGGSQTPSSTKKMNKTESKILTDTSNIMDDMDNEEMDKLLMECDMDEQS